MAIFTPRTSKAGMSNSDSVYNNIHYVGGLQSNPNSNLYNYNNVNTYQCTYYALGRSGEIAGEPVQSFSIAPNPNIKHKIFKKATGFDDANKWITGTNWETSEDKFKPKLGAIVCYNKYPNDGGAGHVQVIEKIEGNTIYVSQNQTAYSDNFLTAINVNDLTTIGSKVFQGYIYNPYIEDEPTPPTPGENPVVTLLAEPSEGGYCTGGGEYVVGTEATFTAYPNSGYEFVSWSDGYTGNPRYWTIETSFTLRAIFKKKVEPRKDIRLDNSITVKALEVLTGKYGSGFVRKHKLGKEYADVQYQVNYLIHNYHLYELLAFEVLVGLWGNGRTRKRKLEAKGFNYYKVQAYVNMYKDKNVL